MATPRGATTGTGATAAWTAAAWTAAAWTAAAWTAAWAISTVTTATRPAVIAVIPVFVTPTGALA
jgi:hypothetical protein